MEYISAGKIDDGIREICLTPLEPERQQVRIKGVTLFPVRDEVI